MLYFKGDAQVADVLEHIMMETAGSDRMKGMARQTQRPWLVKEYTSPQEVDDEIVG